MVKLAPLRTELLEQVIQLSVAEQQLPYVGTIDEVLINADEHTHPHIVLKHDQVIGIFLIDMLYSQSYEFAESGSLGFRAFLIDQHQQGQGYGGKVMGQLRGYLAQHYPNHHSIYLTVNCKNTNAYQCYVKNGFHDTNECYLGGAAGPQHIMLMKLHA
ncbi:GNAT family N-acetyltransferase [Vibrio ouci]|uniref:GNAT family N-acetyltransferase n=1 Tax=Vibrio ouci TaxID=2499078 RepID=A0A4Y8WIA7_9VIBR|nr:GNAT family N-acetyltransferase [Vibrio ouci]TFH92559.1 GNAT family N-acetyltransferase [Vibrio ouci]